MVFSFANHPGDTTIDDKHGAGPARSHPAVEGTAFEGDASSARPDGSMRVLTVVWWNHGCLNGKVSSARIQASLKVAEDGKVEVAPVKDGPQPEIIPGF